MGFFDVFNFLEEDIFLYLLESIFFSIQIVRECLNGREEDGESCKLYEEERMINVNIQLKIMEDEILVLECILNIGNFDLKCFSFVDQVFVCYILE